MWFRRFDQRGPAACSWADVVVAAGIQRFAYFRLLDRLRRGEATLEVLRASQDLYDNHFLDSPAWTRDRQAS
ncbi:hypothetical protein [Nonomuraea roseola]|uniref:Uncharacterized protein n=1 Tax=Nonomuraea roseola TaxID=46179 RepID=A0ABV5QCP7_9ACTN